MERTFKELQDEYNALDIEAGRYNRPEFDVVYSIISELVKDRGNVGDNGNLAFPLVTGDVIDEALRQSGFAEDECFVSDFIKYRDIEQQARDIQLKAFDLPDHPVNKLLQSSNNHNVDGWKFCTPKIIFPEQAKPFFDKKFEEDMKECKGLFAIRTDIPLENEEDDDFLMIDAYGMICSLEPYYRELQEYGVVKCLFEGRFESKELKKIFFNVLKNLVLFIKDNTTTPNKVRNEIISTLKKFDNILCFGLIWQILLLQGIVKWLTGININEGDNGFHEAQGLCDWICKQLMSKEVAFCLYPFGDEDKEILNPLCDYLYSTKIGKIVQNYLFKQNQMCGNMQNEVQTKEDEPADLNNAKNNINSSDTQIEEGFDIEIRPDEIFMLGAFEKFVLLEEKLIEDKYIDNEKRWIAKQKNNKINMKCLQIFVKGLQQNNYFLPKKNSIIRRFFESRYSVTILQAFEPARLDKLKDEYKARFHDYNIESQTQNRIRS